MRPKIVVMCGSSRFVDVMAVCAWLIEKQENAIVLKLNLLPEWYCKGEIPDHLAEHEGVSEDMDQLHLRKIDMADEIFVVDYEHYIGDSTRKEMLYAQEHMVDMRMFSTDPIGVQVTEILQAGVELAEEDEG